MTDETIFAAALAIPDAAARAAYLDGACAGRPELRRDVEGLLAAHAADNPIDRPPADLARTGAYQPDPDNRPAAVPGDRVGSYRLMEQIGEGGFGLVFVAEQTEPVRRKVALKVLKPGMDSRDVVARFEAERQALALMDHPNIAKVFDAGSTPAGWPYFVMELVRGVPITDFCDRQKLSTRDRLALFAAVCQAVQHAHTKGVIHRDLKPSNVLVTVIDGVPVPKVIDFGVAKAVGQTLTDKTIYTRFAQMIGTPLYMSPEQAEMSGVDVDTRADVYALGVLLYELLTGTTPFDRDRLGKVAFDELRRILREEEPPWPSTRLSSLGETLSAVSASRSTDPGRLTGLVRGELDWIVMRCLEKDRNRRYETANGLARDVQRYLSGDAVEACPPTLGYRLRKAYRRNRTAILTAGAFAAVLVAATAVSVALALHAVRSRRAAERAEEAAARDRDAAVDAGNEANTALGQLRQAQEEQQAAQYVWDMRLLPLALEAGSVAEVNRLLSRHVPHPGQPDRRGFEWYYWDRQLHSELRTDQLPDVAGAHGNWAASPDGTRVARLGVPEQINPPPGALPPDSMTLMVWDVPARKVLLTHRLAVKRPADQPFASINPIDPKFSPDGTRVLLGWNSGAGSVATNAGPPHPRQVVDVATGKVVLEFEAAAPWSPLHGQGGAFSPDGRRFAAVVAGPPGASPFGRSRIRVWDLDGGREVCDPLEADDLADPPFSPDGTRLLTLRMTLASARAGFRVAVRALDRGEEVVGWDVPPETWLHALTLSPDGKRIAGVLSDRPPRSMNTLPRPEPRGVSVWDAATGKELHALPLFRQVGSTGSEVRAFFSPDGSRLAVERHPPSFRPGTGSSDLSLWDAATGKPLPPPAGFADAATGRAADGAFSPDGKQLVAAAGNVLRAWDVETGRRVLTLRGHVNPVGARAFSADGKRLWSLEPSGLLKEWDLRPPAPVAIPLVMRYDPAGVSSFAVSPDGGRVATLVELRDEQSAPFAVRVWDAAGNKVKLLVPPPHPVRRADVNRLMHNFALSRDGRRVVLTRADFARPGREADASPPPDLTIWDAATGTILLHQKLDGRYPAHPAISPDGSTVAVATRPAGEEAAAVRVFDVEGRRERPTLPLPGLRAVAGLVFSPDGGRLAALALERDGGPAGKLIVWDAVSGERTLTTEADPVARFSGEFGARLAWWPDGSRFAFAAGPWNNAAVTVHDAATGKRLATMEQPVAGDAGGGSIPCVAWSPDGSRLAAYISPRTVGSPPEVKLWDAASGKELLTLRPGSPGLVSGTRRLTFTGDGRRLVLTELVNDPTETRGGSVTRAVTRSLLLTTWDATPVGEREGGKP